MWISLVAQMVKNLPAVQGTQVWPLSWEDPLEKGMATLAWKIPWTEDPGSSQDSKESDTTEQLTLVWCSPISLFLFLFPLPAEIAKKKYC